jgi:hypothetical protein
MSYIRLVTTYLTPEVAQATQMILTLLNEYEYVTISWW